MQGLEEGIWLPVYVHSAQKHTYLKNANLGINAVSFFSALKNAQRFAVGAFLNTLNTIFFIFLKYFFAHHLQAKHP